MLDQADVSGHLANSPVATYPAVHCLTFAEFPIGSAELSSSRLAFMSVAAWLANALYVKCGQK